MLKPNLLASPLTINLGLVERGGVKIRATEVPRKYKRTTAKMDRSLGHDNGQGAVTRTLTEYGGVMPLSDIVRGLRRCTTSLTSWPQPGWRKVGLQRGRPGSDQELAIITSRLGRRISAATVRASFTLLLEKMAQVGEGARRAENRRGWREMEEERMRLDREAEWLSRVRGVGLLHRGRFFA
jgi:hypothetical protein